MSNFPTIQLICPVDAFDLSYSTQPHFEKCEDCKRTYQDLSKNYNDFPTAFKIILQWARISSHVNMLSKAYGSVSFEGGQKILAHKEFHMKLTNEYDSIVKLITEKDMNSILNILEHLFPNS